MEITRKIEGGLYLVVDLKPGIPAVMPKVKGALEGGVDVVQLWCQQNIWEQHEESIIPLCDLIHTYDVPVLIYENWQWLQKFPLDGVHFDSIPKDLSLIKKKIGHPFLAGLTCGNDMTKIGWAVANKFDYISFCSMFPSSTANSCEFVRREVVEQSRAMTDMTMFAAGGITLENLSSLLSLGINGIAIVSGIMKAENPMLAAKNFKERLANRKDTQNQTTKIK